MALALMALPTMAQEDQWQSTSSMQGSGSVYSSQVNAVGAVGVSSMATTTDSYSPAKAPGGPRRGYDANGNWVPDAQDMETAGDTGQSDQSPLGDAVLPMLLFAAAFCGVIAFRRRRAALNR